jgi:hypothetical protein
LSAFICSCACGLQGCGRDASAWPVHDSAA